MCQGACHALVILGVSLLMSLHAKRFPMLSVPTKDIEHAVVSSEVAVSGAQELNAAIPYSEHKDRGEMKGWSEEKIKLEWKKLLVDDSVTKVQYKGQTLVSRFAGVHFTVGNMTETSSSFKSYSGKIGSSEQMDEAKRRGSEAVATAVTSGGNWASQFASMAALQNEALEMPHELISNLIPESSLEISVPESVAAYFRESLDDEQRRQEMLDNLLKVDQVEASFYAKEGDSETAADVAKFRVSKNSDFTKAKETYELVLQTLGTDIKEAVDGAKGSLTEAAAEAAKEAYKVLEDSESVLEEHGTQWAPQCAIVCVCSTVSKFLFMLNKSLLI